MLRGEYSAVLERRRWRFLRWRGDICSSVVFLSVDHRFDRSSPSRMLFDFFSVTVVVVVVVVWSLVWIGACCFLRRFSRFERCNRVEEALHVKAVVRLVWNMLRLCGGRVELIIIFMEDKQCCDVLSCSAMLEINEATNLK